ncbi:MAG TPA: hypothetical protein VKD67_03020, partial [Acidimicrobiales bacterium]|nr:hypothetical protein [Acidimicrobiales bacterium]
PIPASLPLFPPDNWWNLDISAAPVDSGSASFVSFIGATRTLHPDFGGDAGGVDIYGFPYAVVDGAVTKKAVAFDYADESDGVNHTTGASFPFYPIPDEAATQPHWIEGGPAGNVDLRSSSDRHLLIVDGSSHSLYELYNVFYDGAQWHAGSGAYFDLNTNGRRPDGWTSADAAGLAILPGLVRYDEVASGQITHAIRVTFGPTYAGYIHPATHQASSQTDPALPPMGLRLRLNATFDTSGYTGGAQVILEAMKRFGLIVADNGSNWFITGAADPRWDDDNLDQLKQVPGSAFEVVDTGPII